MKKAKDQAQQLATQPAPSSASSLDLREQLLPDVRPRHSGRRRWRRTRSVDHADSARSAGSQRHGQPALRHRIADTVSRPTQRAEAYAALCPLSMPVMRPVIAESGQIHVPGATRTSVLSDRSIREEIEAGRLVIDPWDESLLQPASVDLRLGREFRVFRNYRMPYIDVKQETADADGAHLDRRGHPVHPAPGRVRPRRDAWSG